MAPISTGSNGNPACMVNPAANAAAVTTIATRTMTSSIASPPEAASGPVKTCSNRRRVHEDMALPFSLVLAGRAAPRSGNHGRQAIAKQHQIGRVRASGAIADTAVSDRTVATLVPFACKNTRGATRRRGRTGGQPDYADPAARLRCFFHTVPRVLTPAQGLRTSGLVGTRRSRVPNPQSSSE